MMIMKQQEIHIILIILIPMLILRLMLTLRPMLKVRLMLILRPMLILRLMLIPRPMLIPRLILTLRPMLKVRLMLILRLILILRRILILNPSPRLRLNPMKVSSIPVCQQIVVNYYYPIGNVSPHTTEQLPPQDIGTLLV